MIECFCWSSRSSSLIFKLPSDILLSGNSSPINFIISTSIDLPGFGASDVDADSSYDVTVHLDAITAALDALGVDQLGLCVHDAGGYYGLLWAVQHPERITELCILNTVASPKVSLLARATIQAYRIPLLRDLLAMPFAAKIGMQMGMSKRRLDKRIEQINLSFLNVYAKVQLISLIYPRIPPPQKTQERTKRFLVLMVFFKDTF